LKVALTSDVHLEFGPMEIKNEENARVLILSGDIYVAADRDRFIFAESNHIEEFFNRASKEFEDVIYVMGNHEHYHGDFAKTYDLIKRDTEIYKNVHFLEKETVTIEDKLFFGATFWTNMDKANPVIMNTIRYEMNDYRTVKNSNEEVTFNHEDGTKGYRIGKLIPSDTVKEHYLTLNALNEVLEKNKDKEVIVVGHHAPSKLSTHPRYKDESTNAAYSSDLSEIMLNNTNIKLWTHGHTHEPYDYTIGSTRVVANPRGYIGYEEMASSHRLKYLDV